MAYLIAGMIGGAFFSWIITHFYYYRSNISQAKNYNKLSVEIRTLIEDDKRNSLSVFDLNKLLEEKTMDKESRELYPYIVCPKCGSDNIEKRSDCEVETEAGDYGEVVQYPNFFEVIECLDCGWKRDERQDF